MTVHASLNSFRESKLLEDHALVLGRIILVPFSNTYRIMFAMCFFEYFPRVKGPVGLCGQIAAYERERELCGKSGI